MKNRVSVILVFAALASSGIAAASDYPFDLATHPGGEVNVSISPGRIRPVILHRLPGRQYNVQVVRETIPVGPLGLPSGITIPAGAAIDPECLKLKADFDKIAAPTDEVGVGKAATDISALLSETKCVGQTKDLVAAALAKYANSLPFDEYAVGAGQLLRIKVERLDAKGQPEKTWTLTLTTGARGEWLTTYGLTFVPLRDELFFSKEAAEQG